MSNFLLKITRKIPHFNIFGRQSSSAANIIEKKANIDGVNINYVQSGSNEPDSKSVLLMPGALGTVWTDFKPQIESLPSLLPSHTIIGWDPPGYGKSVPYKRDFSQDFFNKDAEYAKKLMETLGRPKFSILGWSDGGITGIILAGTYPEVVDKLVIWGTGAYINFAETKLLESVRDVKKWSKTMREPMEKVYGTEGFPKLWKQWLDGVINIYKNKGGDYCKKEVDKITSPTFILHGKRDPLIAEEHIPYLLHHLKDAKYYEFPDGKHNIHLRYAQQFNELVAQFLA